MGHAKRALKWIHVLVIVLALATSILLTDAEKSFCEGIAPGVRYLEYICTGWFTFEIFLSWYLYSSDSSLKQSVEKPISLDIAAASPAYFEIMFGVADSCDEGRTDNGTVRALEAFVGMLRLLRAARLIRAFTNNSRLLGVLGSTIVESRHVLLNLGVLQAIAMVLFSSALYYSELFACPLFTDGDANAAEEFARYSAECQARGESSTFGLCCNYVCNPRHESAQANADWQFRYFDEAREEYVGEGGLCLLPLHPEDYKAEEGEDLVSGLGTRFVVKPFSSASFRSIPRTFWFTVVSITTVGYGDVVPASLSGRFIASVAMCIGILIIALPVGIVGSKFQEAYKDIPMRAEPSPSGGGADPKAESPQASAKPSIVPSNEEVRPAQSGGSSPVVPRLTPPAAAAGSGEEPDAAGSGEPPTVPSRTTTPAASVAPAEPEGLEFVDLGRWIASLDAGGQTVNGSRQHVDKLVTTYDRLAEVAAQVATAQREYMSVQQELGYEMDHLLSARRRNVSGTD
jgi:hypothetical protein